MNAKLAKAVYLFVGLATLSAIHAVGQVQTSTSIATSLTASPGYICVQRGPDSKVWQQAVMLTNADGDVSTNYQSYTELATGLSYLNNNGQLVDSVEEVDAIPGGAQSVQGRHKVQWALNANTPGGATTITLPDGKKLSVTVFGMAYYDSATGSNAPVAYLQDSTGTIAAPNQVIYGNAFSNLNADLCYTYTKAGVSQDVILRQAPPAPDAYGLSDATTVLQVYSEFFNAMDPAATAVTNGNVLDDQVLNFGSMSMGVGQALFFNGQGDSITTGAVGKQWIHVNGRTFLIESVSWSAISNQVQALHPASNLNPRRGSIRGLALLDSGARSPHLKEFKMNPPMKLARSEIGGRRLVVDFDLLSGSQYLTLQGDTTYLVSSVVYITNVLTIEGGAVIKYTNTGAGEISVTGSGSNIVCETGPYRPAVFTSMYDGSVGALIATGTPSVTGTYLNFSLQGAQTTTLRYLRFSYAASAVEGTFNNSGNPSDWIKLQDCQFFDCATGFWPNVLYNSGFLYLYNVLFSGVACGVNASSSNSTVQVGAVNVTADAMNYFTYNMYGPNVSATNCVFTAVTNLPLASLRTDCATAPSGAGVYQVVGAGSYYLTNSLPGNTNRGVGTTSIDSNLLADLQTLTTYPPAVLPTYITTSTNLGPFASLRNTGAPDLGFHYLPVDYAANSIISNATVTVSNGVVVAGYGAFGFSLYGTSPGLNFNGTATSPAYFVRYNTLQEQSNPNWEATWFGCLEPGTQPAQTEAAFDFTDWCVLAGEMLFEDGNSGYPSVSILQNCQLSSGQILLSGQTVVSTNCLYQRVATTLLETGGDSEANTFCNNLLWNGSMTVRHSGAGAWTFWNNLFDQCDIANKMSVYAIDCLSNAYATNLLSSPQYLPGDMQSTIVPLAASPAYQTGTLGKFYYPSNQTNLIFYGSQLASAAGLYHYTVTTNNTIDGTNTVSIGFHYVATDNNGIPLDMYGDGVPDYLKDANGDGLYDRGDLVNWQNPFNIYDQGKSYGGYYPANVRLGYWRFNTSAMTDEHGNSAFTNSGITPTADWSSNSAYLTSGSELQYYTVQPGGTWTNFDAANGTVRFWFKPHWSSDNIIGGTGPGAGSGANGTFLNISSDYAGWLLEISPEGEVMQFESWTNGYIDEIVDLGSGGAATVTPGAWDCTFMSNQWYQIAFAYTSSNIAAYVNGALIGTGEWPPTTIIDGNTNYYQTNYGMSVWPPIGTSIPFSIGNDTTVANPLNGEMDELETFNYPLTAQAIAYGFATFNGSATLNTTDSDYVGRNDILRTQVDGVTLPAPNNITPCRLGYWRFNSPLWLGEQGQFPTSANGVTMGTGWSGGALNVGSAPNSGVTYPAAYSNGWASINCREGSVRFWFQPNWTSAPVSAPFIYVGSASSSANYWTLETGTSANTISFNCTANGATPFNAIQNIAAPFATNQWTQVAVTYGPSGTILYVNGSPVKTNTLVFTNWPNSTALGLAMVIGNDAAGNSPINGKFDELETFNYQLNANQIWTNFLSVWNIDNNLDGVPDIIQDTILPRNIPFLGRPVVVTGTIEAEQFDRGGPGYAYANVQPNPPSSYRATGMDITPCNDLGGGYCLDQLRSGDWADYTINVLVPQAYAVETRVAGIGTNGIFQEVFFWTNGVAYATNGPFHVTSNVWETITGTVNLKPGTNVMQLQMIAPGYLSNYVGQFNYFTIYPWWQAGFTSISNYPISPSVLSNNINTWTAATNNAIQIQNAVNYVATNNGGTVTIPGGTYYVAQQSPVETNQPWQNAAVSILGTNITISGTNIGNTTLIAYNRATSIFYAGKDAFTNTAQCTNITFLNMTMEAQQHAAVNPTNQTLTVYESGQFYPANSNASGMLLGILGLFVGPQYAYNILISNCQFLNADRPIDIQGYASNVLVRQCNFLWQSNLYTPYLCNTNIPNSRPDTSFIVGIVGRYPIYNIGVVESTYVGATNTGTNYILNQVEGGNGFILYQGGGNSFALRNLVTNNAEEAMEFYSGPVAVAGNTFWSLAINNAACALAPNFDPAIEPLGSGYFSDSLTFVGNSIVGNAFGALNDASGLPGPYSLNFSGNTLQIFLPTNPTTNNAYIGSAVYVNGCQNLNFCGNTMTSGGTGITYISSCSNSVILANNFSPVTLRSILDWGTQSESGQVIGNLLGRGVGYHLKAYSWEGPNWFLYANQYLDAHSNAAPAFTDSASLWAHISP